MLGSNPTVQIALPLPLDSTFTYLWPDSLQADPAIGRRVLVPFGKRRMAGYVVDIHPRGTPPREVAAKRVVCRDVLSLLDDEPLFDIEDLRLYEWVSRYYLASLGETLRTALPGSMHVRSCRGVRILPQGLLAIEQGLFLTRQEREILELLRKSGKRTWKSLQEKTGAPLERWVQSLEGKGFAIPCQVVRGKQEQKHTGDLLVESAVDRSDPSLPSFLSLLDRSEAQVLETLLENGPCLQADLDRPEEDSGDTLSRLLDKGMIRMTHPARHRAEAENSPPSPQTPRVLTASQNRVVERILPSVQEGSYRPFLLHGVTGSGKTEVYMTVIEQVLRKGREALVLVPEIGLTPQTVQWFTSRFGSRFAVLHSAMLESERLEGWWKIRKGLVKIAIGTRSAVFAPFQNLGVIVVDEEHDPSYKQQERLRYNARDLALVRGQRGRSVVLLGSATPSLESYYNARTGKSTLLELSERIEGQPLPPITCVDIRDRSTRRDYRDAISIPLEQSLKDNVRDGKKSLLFLNRRGYAPSVICTECGHLFRCPRCSVTLTFHRARKRISCHYCEHEAPPPTQCPACQGHAIQTVGKGTERIEEEVRALVPQARIGRMDRDTTRKRGAHARLLRQFRGEDLDILIGTQMIAKGHDIPEITLVGVVQADVSLDLPDFRSSERTFQLLLQVAGRAGRGPWPGRVLVQTRHPDHYCLRTVACHDYKQFYEQEIVFRRELNYPPFSRMINLRISGPDQQKTSRAAARLGTSAREALRHDPFRDSALEILGPSEAPLGRLRGRYRHHCFLKGGPPRLLLALAREVADRGKIFLDRERIQLEIDVDPIQML
jgi:primosomal protein N' (replication factor Y) (superfamily II helicase)